MAAEVEGLYQEGGTFFLLRRKGAVLGFALTTGIGKFTEQFRSDSGGRLVTPKPLNLDEYVYLYQVAIRKGEEQRGLGGALVQHVQNYHTQPLLADVLTAPVPNLGSRFFFERLGFRKVGVLELDSYRDYGSLTSDVLVDGKKA
jgi:ribosomal protein S18 acetylase RimI-like enzyme